MKSILKHCIFIISLLIFFLSSAMITSRLTDAYHKRNLLNDIRSEVYGEVKKLDKDIFRMEETKISLFPNWRHHRQDSFYSLYQKNSDLVGWIGIEDTVIDYPVMQSLSEPDFYLKRDFNKEKSSYGSIYTDAGCHIGLSKNYVLYGHHMKDGSMFAGLHRYSDIEFMEEHPYIYMYTPEGLLVYEIFTAHETSDEHILYAHNWFEEERVMEEYIYETRDVRLMGSVQREDVEVESDDHILTLSTCVSNPNNRFIVQGVLLNGSEE